MREGTTRDEQMSDYISTKDAAVQAEVTEPTMINWCRRYGIGIKVGGRWRVNPLQLKKMLEQGIQDDETDNGEAGS
jgi:hypothetical protein